MRVQHVSRSAGWAGRLPSRNRDGKPFNRLVTYRAEAAGRGQRQRPEPAAAVGDSRGSRTHPSAIWPCNSRGTWNLVPQGCVRGTCRGPRAAASHRRTCVRASDRPAWPSHSRLDGGGVLGLRAMVTQNSKSAVTVIHALCASTNTAFSAAAASARPAPAPAQTPAPAYGNPPPPPRGPAPATPQQPGTACTA